MPNRFELHKQGYLSEHLPTITDPYRECWERNVRLSGKKEIHGRIVVPIDNPPRFFRGLKHLIRDTQTNNEKADNLEPSPFDPVVGTRFNIEDQEKYKKDLGKMFKKYFRIHKDLLKGFTEGEKNNLKNTILAAIQYRGTDATSTDPAWTPGTDHSNGLPYGYWPYKKEK